MISSYEPRVTVGIPVYNGARFLDRSIASVLAQTFEDFELILVDNASTDDTEGICRAYAASDARVRYVRQAVNVGASENFNTAFRLSRSLYFKWLCHDDICAPTFLERCVPVLDAQPDVVIAHGRSAFIDAKDRPLTFRAFYGKPDPGDVLNTPDPVERFGAVLNAPGACLAVLGLIRADVLAATPLHQPYFGSDKVLLAALALRGRVVRLGEDLLVRRFHPDQTHHKNVRELAAWISGRSERRLMFPVAHSLKGYLSAVWAVSLAPRETTRALRVLLTHATRPEVFKRLVLPGQHNYFGIAGKPRRVPADEEVYA